jgi:hypothetical protein
MNTHATAFAALAPDRRFPELRLHLSARANDRYWAGAGVDHVARREGRLYPPMAANLTILLVQQEVPAALLHAEQSLRCTGSALTDVDLVVNGVVAESFEKRGRDYAVIDATVATADGSELWRTLHLDGAALRAYSRAGNYHSDPDEARRLGLPGLVAQGMQVCGPAYGTLLDAWGREFLDHGRFDARFVGMVVDDQSVEAAVERHDDDARFEVRDGNGRLAALGTAHRSARVV